MKKYFKNINLSFPVTITSLVFLFILLRITHIGMEAPIFWAFLFVFGFLEMYFASILKVILTGKKAYSYTRFLAHLSAFAFLTIFLFGILYAWFASAENYLFNVLTKSLESGFDSAIYFSGVTLLSIGYGDIVPFGFFRFLSLIEGFIGSFVIVSFFSIGISQIFWLMKNQVEQEHIQHEIQQLRKDVREEEKEIEKIEKTEEEIKKSLDEK